MNRYRKARSVWFRVLKNLCWSNPVVRKATEHWSDEKFIRKNYWWNTAGRLNLEHPKLYTEKLQWLSLHDHSEIRTIASDKYLVRNYVKAQMEENGLPDILIPLIGVYDCAEDIPWETLPDSFVIKANHGSGWNLLVLDKKKLNIPHATARLNGWLADSYYHYGREHQYKDIKPHLVCEEFLRNADGSEIFDYKFMCFNGKPEMLWVDYNRHTHHVRNFYDLDGNPLGYESDEPADYSIRFEKPENYERMLEIARVLAKPFRHVRVDLYNVNGHIYFGELTFSSWGGFVAFRSEELDAIWGNMLPLQ